MMSAPALGTATRAHDKPCGMIVKPAANCIRAKIMRVLAGRDVVVMLDKKVHNRFLRSVWIGGSSHSDCRLSLTTGTLVYPSTLCRLHVDSSHPSVPRKIVYCIVYIL